MNYNKYWDIDDILMGEEMVSCKIIADAEPLAEFFPNKYDRESLKLQETIKLPISLAIPCCQIGATSLETPSYFANEYYNLLQADPLVPDLSGDNKYFYERIQLIFDYVGIEEEDKWKNMIIKTIFKRFFHYFKNSQNVQLVNTRIHKHCSYKEMKFFEKMVNYNNNIKFFKENYSNNNKVLDEKLEAKKTRFKFKKK